MEYKLIKQVRDIDVLRQSFIDLAISVFDLSFQEWYKNGYWTNKYIPYVLAKDNKVIANVSVNIINTIWRDNPKKYIQLGTVMTHPDYRNKGLSRKLLEEVIADWRECCDAIYLYANSEVLDFYTKFGFEQAIEYQYEMPISITTNSFKKLDMENKSDRDILKRCYQKSNPFSTLPMEDNYGLLMFYCRNFLKNFVYYSKKHDTVCVFEQRNSNIICYDIFGTPHCSLQDILSDIGITGIRKVVLGFTPKQAGHLLCTPITGEETLFVFNSKENIFKDNKVMLPLLSHA